MTQDEKRGFHQPDSWPQVIPLNVRLLKRIGLTPALLLTVLMERDKEMARMDGKHTIGEWFALSYAEIADITTFGKTRIVDGLGELKRRGYIESEPRGIPHVQHYRINNDQVFAITGNSTDASRNISKLPRDRKADSREVENRSVNTIPDKVSSSSSLDISVVDTSIGKSIHAGEKGKKTLRKTTINDPILPILQKAVALGGFRNKFPGPGESPTGRLLFAQRFLQSAFSGRLARDFPVSNRDGQRGSLVRYLKESGRSLEEVLYEACTNFNLLRGEDYGFPDKEKLTTNIGAFFYNPVSKFSWFLSLVFNPPKPLASRTIAKDYEKLPLTDGEKKIIASLQGENWDPVMFKKRVTELYNWYHQHEEDLRIVAAYVGAEDQWTSYFSSFAGLLARYRDFSHDWDDWKAANFGMGNKTWARFVARVKEDHDGLDISPPARKLASAKIQWQRDHSEDPAEAKKRAAEHVAFEERAEAFRKGLLEKGDDA